MGYLVYKVIESEYYLSRVTELDMADFVSKDLVYPQVSMKLLEHLLT